MKNKEKYFDEIIQATIKYSYCDFVKKYMKGYDFKLKEYKEFGNEKLCSGKECEKCKNYFITWLEQEHIEKPCLSHDEYVILKNISKGFKWIVRSESENLSLSNKVVKPYKKVNGSYKHWFGIDYDFECYNHLFQFIKWQDEEPYEIKALLDEYEKFYGGKQHEICRF